MEKLESGDFTGKILLLYGDIAKEQLIPKNFVFFQLPEHQHIIQLLENSGAVGLLCATGMNVAMAGGVYPFPMIEDGDFDIPSIFMKDIEGIQLLPHAGERVHMFSDAKRAPANGANLLGRKGDKQQRKIVVSAHIDAKQGTPGAIDNAAGVVVLMLLAEISKYEKYNHTINFVALNGEDYYSVPGQMQYLNENKGRFDQIILNINIDCAGYAGAPTAFSPMNLSESMTTLFHDFISHRPRLVEGAPWYQGDHSLFLQNQCSAIAVASQWFLKHMETQNVTHTPKDSPQIIDCQELVNIAHDIRDFLKML